MHRALTLAAALAAALAAGSASAANICKAEKLSCGTAMPVGGYCECKAHGTTESGTVVAKAAPHPKTNSTAAGCGAQPGSPGCR